MVFWRLLTPQGRDLTGFFVPSGLIKTDLERNLVMAKKRFSAEQIVILLRQIEVLISQGKSPRWRAGELGSGLID